MRRMARRLGTAFPDAREFCRISGAQWEWLPAKCRNSHVRRNPAEARGAALAALNANELDQPPYSGVPSLPYGVIDGEVLEQSLFLRREGLGVVGENWEAAHRSVNAMRNVLPKLFRSFSWRKPNADLNPRFLAFHAFT